MRPIELQLVGDQLQTENIRTLEQYRKRGPKEQLVQRYLEAVVKDCGYEKQQIAELVLYLLTDENNTRPLKTRAELEEALNELVANLAVDDQLDLVLKIFVESGLVLLLPAIPAERYQLVHDYLAAFIRQQQEPRLNNLIAELEAQLAKEREQRQQAEAQRQLTEKELERAEQTRQTLKKGQRNRNILLGLLGIALVAALAGLWVAWWMAQRSSVEVKAKPGQQQASAPVNRGNVYLDKKNSTKAIESYQKFAGPWTKKELPKGGITRVVIRSDKNTIYVHMWGNCPPTDCDWGEVKTDASDANDGVLSITWKFSFAVETQQLTVLKDGRLQVKGHHHFTDHSGKADYDYRSYLVKD